MAWVSNIENLPVRTTEKAAEAATRYEKVRSNQHPDHETDRWPT